MNESGFIWHWCSVCMMRVTQTHEIHIDGTTVTPPDGRDT